MRQLDLFSGWDSWNLQAEIETRNWRVRIVSSGVDNRSLGSVILSHKADGSVFRFRRLGLSFKSLEKANKESLDFFLNLVAVEYGGKRVLGKAIEADFNVYAFVIKKVYHINWYSSFENQCTFSFLKDRAVTDPKRRYDSVDGFWRVFASQNNHNSYCKFAKQWISQYYCRLPNPCDAKLLIDYYEGKPEAIAESRNQWRKVFEKHYPYRHLVK